ncbi:unnamed protein product [Adineta ricciae]|uniref:Uncharacterized protein n=1 Tax=Adineta ricciae TaxID=249248 RepID=A0A815U2J8_ADIRI|nr:unnamed protein product [Adineta ricciae]CAF1510939.1 unnamed protein product [Adineta ricciae]
MSQNYKQKEKSSKVLTTTSSRSDIKREQKDGKPTPLPRNTNNIGFKTASKLITNVSNNSLSHKPVIPPILSGYNTQDSELIDQSFLPLKLFDGKKQSLNELSEESMSYLWLRRIKEIFLRLADGKDDRDDDRFVEFDMDLAKIDLMNTCDRYIENERLALSKKPKTYAYYRPISNSRKPNSASCKSWQPGITSFTYRQTMYLSESEIKR